MTLLDETRIVLLEPSLPENVGSVARAMRHFGLRDLVLVGGVDPCHPLAIRVAAGCEALLHEARRVATLEAALEDAVLIVGTSAHAYQAPDLLVRTPREVAVLARDYAQAGAIALLFGTEKHGLTKEALRRCHQVARIPGEPQACLNLAMAVHLFAYEWYLASHEAAHASETPLLASDPAFTAIAGGWIALMRRSGLLKPGDEASKLHTLRRILSQARLSPDELSLIRAIGFGLAKEALPELGD